MVFCLFVHVFILCFSNSHNFLFSLKFALVLSSCSFFRAVYFFFLYFIRMICLTSFCLSGCLSPSFFPLYLYQRTNWPERAHFLLERLLNPTPHLSYFLQSLQIYIENKTAQMQSVTG